MKKITDRQNASFIAKLEKSLIKLGAFKSSKDVEPYYPLSINTIGGLLYLKIDLDNESFFTLYTMFESLELAKEQNIISLINIIQNGIFTSLKTLNIALMKLFQI